MRMEVRSDVPALTMKMPRRFLAQARYFVRSSADDHLTVGGDADVVVSADLEHLGNVPSTPSAQLGLLTGALSGWC